MHRSLKKDASSEFDSICAIQQDNNQNETIDNFDTAMNELDACVFSVKALSHQKRCVRQCMRKPAEMSIEVCSG